VTAQLLQPGDTVTQDFGPLRVRADRHYGGISITVLVGADRSSALSHPFLTDRLAAARIWYAHLRTAAAGVPVHVIEERLAVIQAAAYAAEQALTDRSNA
jgi:hypothetical protein